MGLKIVVIDDSPDFLDLAEFLIRKSMPDSEITRFDPNAMGLPDTGHGFEEYDLMLLDYDLGASGNGIDWLKDACRTPGFPPTIVITASRNPYIAARAIKSGAVDYLAKEDMVPGLLPEMFNQATLEREAPTQGTGTFRGSDTAATLRTRGTVYSGADPRATLMEPAPSQSEADGDRVLVRGYRVEEKLGEGATARVFRAVRESDGEMVVLKVVMPELLNEAEFLERFLQEAELVTDIDSPHVVKIFEQAFTDDGGFIAMEYLRGGDLRALLKGGVSEAMAVDYLRQMLLGLKAIHEVGIIHRDMKPENVMVREDQSLALVDFGISKRADRQKSLELTQEGSILGTPYYMSPEQAHGLEVDARGDLYAAGVIFHEMLLGKRPFTGRTAAQILYAHAYNDRPTLSGEFARYQPVLDSLVAIKRKERFNSADEALHSLDSVVS